MGKIQKFEELVAWQKARELTTQIYKLTKGMYFSKDFGLCNQIQRAAVSVCQILHKVLKEAAVQSFISL